MDAFKLHRSLISQYGQYSQSFLRIQDARIRATVESEIKRGIYWPEPMVQLNPSYSAGKSIDKLCMEAVLHKDCKRIFRVGKSEGSIGEPLQLYLHQEQAISLAHDNRPYVLTTGTGSGKSLAYIVPIVDRVLKSGSGGGIKAIIVYPMNALANSQLEELDKFLGRGINEKLVTYARYTGQESEEEKRRILEDPPDILLTNYVMLELILTRVDEKRLVRNAKELQFLVLDEFHTYRGRQGADVAMLIRRCREAFSGDNLLCVGTSATMASEEGMSLEARQQVVAKVATKLFGASVGPSQVVGETLQRITPGINFQDPKSQEDLRQSVEWVLSQATCVKREDLRDQPLASWIESSLGLEVDKTSDRLVRAKPKPIAGEKSSAGVLASLAGIPLNDAQRAIRRCLELGVEGDDVPLFAFRLHQFISRGDTAYATLDLPKDREFSLRAHRFSPKDRDARMYPLCFCRSCGQEYYRINRPKDVKGEPLQPRERFEKTIEEGLESGYLYCSDKHPWPRAEEDVLFRLPVDWIEGEDGKLRVARNRKKEVPQIVRLAKNGTEASDGVEFAYFRAPFRFCLNPDCGKAFNFRQRSDAAKLATLGVDGRSTATTILGLTVLAELEQAEALDPEAKKLLSFTDNRQDASLQAGHFNDFIAISLIRSALYRALQAKGESGLRHSELAHEIQNSISAPLELFTGVPLRGAGRESAAAALRQVIEYNLYRDFQSGWRVVSPNLERCGLLQLEYLGLDELVADQEFWMGGEFHGALVTSPPEVRRKVLIALLDHLRRNLTIKQDVLEKIGQEKMATESRQWLVDAWQIADERELEQGVIAWNGSKPNRVSKSDLSLAKQSAYCQFVRKELEVSADDAELITRQLLSTLAEPWGILECVRENPNERRGYQLRAGAIVWKAGDGTLPYNDPLREVEASRATQEGNKFFRKFYERFAELGRVFEGREHTAQVTSDLRQDREDRFRLAELPLLFCSPTMELGIDISQLNVVNMRNVPPTPANYAQRSGRAGRGGQPALVYTYCSGFSPHDQYYFRRQERMVAGSVAAPRLDLLNEDLIRAHVHAIWLGVAGVHLGKTLTEILKVTEDDLSLPLREDLLLQLEDSDARLEALEVAEEVLGRVESIRDASWWSDSWLEEVIKQIPLRFDQACERWRTLYRSAVQQRAEQNRIIGDHSRPEIDRRQATRLRGQAEAQIRLLTDARSAMEGDFYSYRYFASEGFLPGYNFPRLPISAFIPGRRRAKGRDEFLSRPRFLAISEFGPRALIYHEGRRYEIDRVNLAFDADGTDLIRSTVRLCDECGHCAVVSKPPGPDRCTDCGADLDEGTTITNLVQMQNVTAKPRQRITSNEEERRKLGFQIRTAVEMSLEDDGSGAQTAEIEIGDTPFGNLTYGAAATIYQINLGLRANRSGNLGYILEKETGRWISRSVGDDQAPPVDPSKVRTATRVVPFVADRRNALAFRPKESLGPSCMATLQAALKQAVLLEFQLESMEIAASPLPSEEARKGILLFESSEGGAGVLRQLVEDSKALPRLARRALEICHFDPETGEDLAEEGVCSRACDECLLDYGNQRDHDLLDRHGIRDYLLDLAEAEVLAGGIGRSRVEHMRTMMEACDSKLEKKWLQFIDEARLKLPTHAQYKIEAVGTKPDFFYEDENAAIYIDGPPHDTENAKEVDQRVNEQLSSAGYVFVRFHHKDDWPTVVRENPWIFGELS